MEGRSAPLALHLFVELGLQSNDGRKHFIEVWGLAKDHR